ncbi:Ubiquitin family protein [Tritrichomonas foetus]|uniref:UV excision repair protein RAD23 n=1 Tax=Tritrichomonas foetus TaxID=1144522 RepID=A0A1J4KW89_9EUKA|nr:Ubiquitin family protein [Tritrichomonas foetus]|eukprot:OHT13966.1 Ubiquitin family protein [Tritrichomonas foetus]
MLVSFRTISNKLYELECQPTDTVMSIKETLASQHGFNPKKMKLIFKAKVLLDDKTLEACGIDGSGFVVLHAQAAAAQQPKKSVEVKQENQAVTESPNRIEIPVVQTEKPEPPAVSAHSQMPSVAPLPEIDRSNGRADPPGFRQKVQELAAMGFAEGDCENALRAALGNADRAADFLLSGNIPDMPEMISVRDVPMFEEGADNFQHIILSDDEDNGEVFDDDEEEDQMEDFIRFRDELIRHPERLRSFLQQMAEDNPAIASLIRDDPSAFLASIGYNPNDFDLTGLGRSTQYEQLMAQFNDTEQQAIHNLEKLGFDTMTIIQVFVACDKDETAARACLESMM